MACFTLFPLNLCQSTKKSLTMPWRYSSRLGWSFTSAGSASSSRDLLVLVRQETQVRLLHLDLPQTLQQSFLSHQILY